MHPDPTDPAIRAAAERGEAPNFYVYGRLPMWDEEYDEEYDEDYDEDYDEEE